MPEITVPAPRRSHLRLLKRLIAAIVGTLLCLVLAVWLLLNFWVVPHIAQYRTTLENIASKHLGIPVQIGGISAKRNGMLPELTLHSVRLLNPDGRPALTLDEIHAEPSFTALLTFNIRFSTLTIEKPVLDIHRLENGHILVAGLDVTALPPNEDRSATEIPPGILWLLQQPHFQIRQGQILWTDDLLGTPTLDLTQTEIELRNQKREHSIRIDATPPQGWGTPFSVQGVFTEPIIASSRNMQNWNGAITARFPEVNVEQLPAYIPLPITLSQGRGAIELQAQYSDSRLIESRATLNLPEVKVQLAADLPPLHLRQLAGTVTGTWQDSTYRLQTHDLTFHFAPQTQAGFESEPEQIWPPSPLDIRWQFDDDGNLNGGGIHIENVNLNLLARFARGLPLPQNMQTELGKAAPKGMVTRLDAQWEGSPQNPETYSATGEIKHIELTAGVAQPPLPGKKINMARPGFAPLDVTFSLTEQGGEAELRIVDGHIALPGIFEEPVIPIKNASVSMNWQRLDDLHYLLNVPSVSVETPAGSAQASFSWEYPDPAVPDDKGGYFKLNGTVRNGDISQLYLFLPMSIKPNVRGYLRQAFISGTAPEVRFHIDGPLRDFPFHRTDNGIFEVQGEARDVSFNYVPDIVRKPGQRPFPFIALANGEFRATGKGMMVRNTTASIEGAPHVRLSADELSIDDWSHGDTHLIIHARAMGPLTEHLSAINQSAIGDILGGILKNANGTGSVNTKLDMDLTIDHMMDSTVLGKMAFSGNTLSLWPFAPQLSQVEGLLMFTEKGFTIERMQAQTLGGPLRGTAKWHLEEGLTLSAEGHFTAQGVFQDPNWRTQLMPGRNGFTGGADYTINAHMDGPRQVFQVQSDLTGVGFIMPEPLTKTPQTLYPVLVTFTPLTSARNQLWPLLIEATGTPVADSALPTIRASYVLDTVPSGYAITQGTIGINRDSAMPLSGTSAQANLETINVPQWQAFFNAIPEQETQAGPSSHLSTSNLVLPAWWPQSAQIHVNELRFGEAYAFHQAEIQIQRQNLNWAARINAQEASCELDWQNPKSDAEIGLLRGHFSRLWIPKIDLPEQPDPESAEREARFSAMFFSQLPHIALQIDNLRYGEAALGHANLAAHPDYSVNPARWQIDSLEISNGTSSLKASGFWSATPTPATTLQLTLQTENSGQLLSQFGLPQVLSQAPGTLEGELSWQAPPYRFDRASLSGQLLLNLKKGEMLMADPGAGRLLSVLSLQSLPNRLSLDFRDIFKSGFAFDTITGNFAILEGKMHVNKLHLNGINAKIDVTGNVDLNAKTQALEVVVTPEINAGAASLALTAVNPAAGLGSLAVQLLLREPLRHIATRTYHITGSWDEPHVSGSSPPSEETPVSGALPRIPANDTKP